MRLNSLTFLTLVTALLACTLFPIPPAVGAVSLARFHLHLDGSFLAIPVTTSHSLDAKNDRVERAVIVIHGAARNSKTQHAAIRALADSASGGTERILTAAPQFLLERDIKKWELGPEVLFWSSGWRHGNRSLDTWLHPRSARVSSFAVLDALIAQLTDRRVFPRLRDIVVVGHSAGGQFVNRYAAGTRVDELHASHRFRYVVANPSSYLYFDDRRRVEGSTDRFATPRLGERADCGGFNAYKYGIRDLNRYMLAAGSNALIQRYAERNVIYLLGREDTLDSHWMDESCAARLQGGSRLERGTVYFNYLRHFFGDALLERQAVRVVEGVGHDFSGIYASEVGLETLFDAPRPPLAPVAAPPAER